MESADSTPYSKQQKYYQTISTNHKPISNPLADYTEQDELLSEHVEQLKDKHVNYLKQEIQVIIKNELLKLKGKADAYCKVLRHQRNLRARPSKQRKKLTAFMQLIVSKILDRKAEAFNHLKYAGGTNRKRKNKSTSIKKRFLQDDLDQTLQPNGQPYFQLPTAPRPRESNKPPISLTYNVYKVNAKDFKVKEGILLNTDRMKLVDTKVFSGSEFSIVMNNDRRAR